MAAGADIARATAPEIDVVERLARGASIELSSVEFSEFKAAREVLRPGQRIFGSHLTRRPGKKLDNCTAARRRV